ncbi:MAG: SDR family oxidoreductase [Rhizobiales bacterium]|nr:SDR family oxidoreductase [Hyphomicrobiales bacterium]
MNYFDRQPYVVAVIGAASGIGKATAEFLAGQGVTVACIDQHESGAKETASAIKKAGGTADALAADVAHPAKLQAAIAAIIETHGQLDGLVNCAGITGKTNIKTHEVSLEDFDRVYEINLKGALIASQAVLPHMLKRGYGRILHVASIAGKEGNAGMAAYSATKAGLIGLVKVMGKDYAETGITINALAPAVIRTPMVAALPDAQVKYMTDKIPMKRCGELEEAASLIAWIVSPACGFTTGFTFDLTGGRATY